MPCVFKQEGLSARCCYYVQVKLFTISSQTCPLEATDDQIKNDLITGYLDLQGLGCKQSAYDSIMQ